MAAEQLGIEMGSVYDDKKTTAAMTDILEEEELEQTGPGPEFWEFGKAFVVIILVFGFVASIWGIVLNLRQYGEISGVDKDKHTPGPASFINLFWTSAAVALPVLLIRSMLRLYSHRHYHQGFCFVVYVALVALIQHEAFTFQPSLRNTGYSLQATLEKMLYTAPISASDTAGVSFGSLRDATDFYTWARGPLRQFIFGPTKLANPSSGTYSAIKKQMPMWATQAQTISAAAGVTYQNSIIAAVSVRQLRVEHTTCEASSTVKCTGPYTKDGELKTLRATGTPLSPTQTEVYAPREYTNWNGDTVTVADIPGQLNSYPADSGHRGVKMDANTGSGYLYQPYSGTSSVPNLATYDSIVNSWETNNWWDANTRLVEVSIYMYNYNTNLLNTVKLQIEADEAGSFLPGPFSVGSLPLTMPYGDWFAFPSLVYLFYAAGTMMEEMLMPMPHRSGEEGYWGQGRTFAMLEVAILVSLFAYKTLEWEAYKFFPCQGPARVTITCTVTPTMRFATGTTLRWLGYTVTALSVSFFLLVLKVFKFVRDVPVMERIGQTLHFAVLKVAIMACSVAVVFIAFGWMFSTLYRSAVGGFSTIGGGTFTMVRLLFGDFSTVGPMLQGSAGYAEFLLCFFYVFAVFLVATAVLTVLYEADAEAKEEMRKQKPISLIMDLYRQTGDAASTAAAAAAEASAAAANATPCTWLAANCCPTWDGAEDGGSSSGNPEFDKIFDMAFDLHDLNDSKTIDTVEEMNALVNTLCKKLKIEASPQQVHELIASMGNLSDLSDGSLNWTKPKTKDWFLNHFLDVWVNEAEANALYQDQEHQSSVPGVTPQDLPTFLAELEEAGGDDMSQDAALSLEVPPTH